MNLGWKKWLYIVSPFFVLLIIWGIVTNFGLIKPFFLPSPIKVFEAGINLFTQNNFISDIFISLFRILIGFMIGVVLAIPIGLLIGLNKKAEMTLEPLIDFIRYTPIPAFVPLLILWLGIGELEKIIIISASVFFQLALMVANSVSQTPEDMLLFGQTLGLNKLEIVFKIIFPFSWPKIIDDMRVSLGWAWSSLLIAEIVGSTAGIGFVIIQSQRLLKTENVIFAIIVVGALGIFFDWISKIIQKSLFPWFKKSVL